MSSAFILGFGGFPIAVTAVIAVLAGSADGLTEVAYAPGFDAGHIELWPALATGAQLHVVPDEVRIDSKALVEWLVRQRITVAFLPTAIAEMVLDKPWPRHAALRVLCIGGERLNSRPPADAQFTVFNIYGPTVSRSPL